MSGAGALVHVGGAGALVHVGGAGALEKMTSAGWEDNINKDQNVMSETENKTEPGATAGAPCPRAIREALANIVESIGESVLTMMAGWAEQDPAIAELTARVGRGTS